MTLGGPRRHLGAPDTIAASKSAGKPISVPLELAADDVTVRGWADEKLRLIGSVTALDRAGFFAPLVVDKR